MRAWLHRILRNTFASRYRKRRREREVIDRAHSEGALYEQRARAVDEPRVVAASLSDEVTRALEALPVEFRAVLELVILDGLSYREAADRIGCPIGTVMSRLHRARAAMVAQLVPSGAPEGGPVAAADKAHGQPAQARRRPRTRAEKAVVFGGFVTKRAA